MIFHITKDGAGHKVACPVNSREQLMALRDSKENLEALQAVRAGDETKKSKLLQLAYNAWPVNGVLAGCEHCTSTFFHDIDCYDEQQSQEIKALVLSKKDEIGLRMLERSARGGWHLVCQRERGKTILENQVRVARVLRIEMDTSAHDLQRVVFSTSGSAEDLVYLDDEIFHEAMTVEESAEEYIRLKERERRGEEEVPVGAKKANKHFRPWEEAVGSEEATRQAEGLLGTDPLRATSRTQQGQSPEAEMKFKGVPYRQIIEEWWRQNGGEPAEGERNTELHRLAVHLRSICDNKAEVLLAVMPRLGLSEQELKSIIASATKDQPKGKTREIRSVLKTLGIADRQGAEQTATATDKGFSIAAGSQPPEMPQKLPKLIQLLTSKVPDKYKPAVAHAVFPALAIHLWKVRFNYTDNVEHEATLMNCLMAGTGAGKNCISEPINHILADVKRRDDENSRREDEWRKEQGRRGANKDKQPRPEGLVIQIIDSDMTNPALVTRLIEAEEHFVYVKVNEIDLFDKLKGGYGGKMQFHIMCLAFDTDGEYGQTRVGVQSVTGRARMRFNWNASTTIEKGRKYFSQVLTDGPISRINFCTIADEEIGAEQPVYGKYDAAFDEQLKPYIDQLCSARGLIDCPQAFKLAKKLQAESADFARMSQSRTYWNLSHRAKVIAWLKACVLYVANGYKWEKTFDDFIRWSLEYDLWCKMQFFGAAIEQTENAQEQKRKPGPRNLLTMLPQEFTLEDAVKVRLAQGLDRDGAMGMIRMWKQRGYIEQITDNSYKNLRTP